MDEIFIRRKFYSLPRTLNVAMVDVIHEVQAKSPGQVWSEPIDEVRTCIWRDNSDLTQDRGLICHIHSVHVTTGTMIVHVNTMVACSDSYINSKLRGVARYN